MTTRTEAIAGDARAATAAGAAKEGTVYAIAFEMDIESLRQNYGDPVQPRLSRSAASWKGMASPGSKAVFISVANELTLSPAFSRHRPAQSLPWFAASVRDIRILPSRK